MRIRVPQGEICASGKKQRVEFIHKTIIKRREILQAVRTRFLQALEEKDLRARIELLQEVTQLSHGIAAGRYAQDIVNQALDELLRHIFTRQIPFRKLAYGQEFVERDGLGRKWD